MRTLKVLDKISTKRQEVEPSSVIQRMEDLSLAARFLILEQLDILGWKQDSMLAMAG